MLRRVRTIASVVLLAISISLLIGGFAPARREIQTQRVSLATFDFPPPFTAARSALPEGWTLTLEEPRRLRAGESSVIHLTLTPDSQGNAVSLEERSVVVETRLDLTGAQVSPPGLVSQPFAQGKPASFFWNLHLDTVGVYHGTIWLYLRFIDRASGAESQMTLSAHLVEVEAINFFGLPGDLARALGVIGTIAGTLLNFPLASDILRYLIRRDARSE